jgi:PAT family beta-lactamase induction signal transducer AmpG
MQMLDGYGYKLAGGVNGSFMMDALVSLAACTLLAVPVIHWLRSGKLEIDGGEERLQTVAFAS